jgi:hypothetical protein
VTCFQTDSAQRLQPFVAAKVLDADTLALTDAMLSLVGPAPANDAVLLAAALAVRAPSEGSSCVDLARIAETAVRSPEVPLPWPLAEHWPALVASASDWVRPAEAAGGAQPLVLAGSRL